MNSDNVQRANSASQANGFGEVKGCSDSRRIRSPSNTGGIRRQSTNKEH